LTPLATGSLERSLLVFSTPGGLTGNDLSRLFFTCTNTSQAATCTCNTYPRISPHNVVNHSSHKEATIHQSSNHTWSSLSCGGFKLGSRRFPCWIMSHAVGYDLAWSLLSVLLDLARSNRFIKLPCVAWILLFMFNSCNIFIAQFRLIRFGSILFVIHVLHAQIFGLMRKASHAFSNSRIRINLDCHVLWVQAC
jgi:hypothetical protein